jgi:beta-glucosidase
MKGRTYKYMTEVPLYPFGYGLSYSRFEYDAPRLSNDKVNTGDSLDIEISVRNAGDVPADEIVQLYLSIDSDKPDLPISSLIGFQRLSLSAGATGVAKFSVKPEQMQAVDEAGNRQFIKGRHTLHIGGVSPGARGETLTGQALQTASFELR